MRSFLIFFFLTGIAFSTECKNIVYKIKEGDTLTTISQSIYGNSTLWSIIFEQNRAKIKDPYQITIGEEIEIPCIEGIKSSTDKPKQNLSKIEVEKVIEKTIKIDIISTTALHPFMKNSSSHKDMLTDIVKESFNSLEKVNYSIDYIENRDIHSTLLEKGKYGLSIGWYRPNSTQKNDNLIYSDSLFQTITALYRRKSDNREIKNSRDIYGTKICRPKGWFSFDLVNQGLIDGQTITLVTKKTPEVCFHNLKDGKVDFVSLTSFIGDATMSRMGLSRYIESVKSISTVVDLTLISHKQNPNGELYISKFNQGLKKIDKSGKLEEIQSQYLQEFYNSIKN
jgi:polar amino acid transport system substrate-binding protein